MFVVLMIYNILLKCLYVIYIYVYIYLNIFKYILKKSYTNFEFFFNL